ncbi:MAG: hypothetical protein NT159_00530 [Proteobacteria bacterium]|nr:hypothetical protein [Pseudomonadota bacterium]
MANILATPRFWRKKAVVLKAGGTYGIDAVPTGAANWFEARNVSLTSFEAETVDRNLVENWMGNTGKLIVSKWSKLSFEIALAGSGVAGTAPKWAPMMLACGYAETIVAATSAAYNLVSSAFGFADAYLEIDGTLYKFIGCRGNVKIKITAKGIPVLMVELTSLYTAPSAAAIAGIVKTGWTYESAVNSVNTGKVTLNAVDLAFSTLEVDSGNQIARVDLPGPQLEVVQNDRKSTASLTVLAPALATFDPYALAVAGTVVNLTNTHGVGAGNQLQTDLKVRVMNVKEDQIDGMLAYQLTLEPTPVSGNDEIALTNK